jgi:hypothetical protein
MWACLLVGTIFVVSNYYDITIPGLPEMVQQQLQVIIMALSVERASNA